MIKFKTIIQKFDSKGEKTGWTYIEVPEEMAQKLKPGNKKSFRVKGKLDSHAFKQVALIPMGEGDFIMPLNAEMRKAIGKKKGYEVMVQLTVDDAPMVLSADLMECLNDDPKALKGFNSLANGERKYFSNWIESAKTEATKAKRIAQTVNAMLLGQRYGEMIRALKAEKEKG